MGTQRLSSKSPLQDNARKAGKLVSTPILAVILVLVLSILSMHPPLVRAAELHVGPGQAYATIQAAVTAASPGDTITVHPATYDEQVVVGKGLIIQGYGDTTIVKPSSAATLTQVFDGLFWYGTPNTKQIAGIIVANVPDGSSVTIKYLKVDESSVTTKPAGADYLAGIFYRETGGTVDTVTIVGGGAWSDSDRAYGMYLSAATNTVSVEVKGSTITNFDKNGIEADGNKLTVNVHHNTITGRGPTLSGDEVQNGVYVGRDAVGTVNHNTISSLAYQPETSWAAAIMFYHYVSPTGKSAAANGNTITNCQIGIIFKNANGVAQGNTVSGGTVGLIGIYAEPNYAGPSYTADFVGNTVSGVRDTGSYQNAAIGANTYATLTPGTGASLTVTIESNQLTSGSTSADGIIIGGTAGSVVATIKNNKISNWQHGISLKSSSVGGATIVGNTVQNNLAAGSGIRVEAGVNAANVHANFNNIVSNTGTGVFGVSNGGTGTLDAENNWWGSTTGPTHTSNPGGKGDRVSDNVDFTPWLKTQISGGDSKTCPAGGTTTVGSSTLGVSAEVTTTTGTPKVTVATYASNPGAVTFSAFGKYVDLLISSADGVTQVMIKVYYTDAEIAAAGLVESLLKLYWWNGRSWVACSDTGVNTVDNFIWARITASTVPNLSQLIGSPFGNSWDD